MISFVKKLDRLFNNPLKRQSSSLGSDMLFGTAKEGEGVPRGIGIMETPQGSELCYSLELQPGFDNTTYPRWVHHTPQRTDIQPWG